MTSTTQLELNLGMLTADQQERVDQFRKASEAQASKKSATAKRIEQLLLSGGFQPGIHFVNDFECKTITETRSFGFGDNKFEAEVTFTTSTGGWSLITDCFNPTKNEMTIRKVSLDCEYDKLECSAITSQYRAYKPTTLFGKLEQYNADQKNEHVNANKTKAVLDYTIEKYTKLFPNATVEGGKDYVKSNRGYAYREFSIVCVKFESGSWISFRLGNEVDREYTHKKFNKVQSEMTSMEVLEMFNNQEVKK